jgi:hypothetical protein
VKKRGGILEWLARMAEVGRNEEKLLDFTRKVGRDRKNVSSRGRVLISKTFSKNTFFKEIWAKIKKNSAFLF